MKLVFGLLLLTAVLIISILAAHFVQINSPISNSSTTVSSGVENGLQLSMTLDSSKTIFKQREDINLTFALINVSNKTINFTNENAISIFNFEVYNHNNNWVSTYEIGAYPLINESILILPKANYTETLTWGQGGFPDVNPSQQVPAGTYYIIGNTNEPNDVIPNLQTPRLTITIEYQLPLIEITIVFLVAVVSCVSVGLLLYRRHQKTIKTNQQTFSPSKPFKSFKSA